MKPILDWLNCNRARAAAIVTIVIGWLGPVGVPDFVVAGLLSIVGILVGTAAVHNVVTPVSTAVATATAAAESAATKVAETLTEATAGPTGAITEAGEAIVDIAALDGAQEALKDAGFTRKERTGA